MVDGGLLMNDPFNNITAFNVRNIFDHMVVKDCYEAGLISEDEWKSYLKRLMSMATKEKDDGNHNTIL